MVDYNIIFSVMNSKETGESWTRKKIDFFSRMIFSLDGFFPEWFIINIYMDHFICKSLKLKKINWISAHLNLLAGECRQCPKWETVLKGFEYLLKFFAPKKMLADLLAKTKATYVYKINLTHFLPQNYLNVFRPLNHTFLIKI